MNKNSRTKNTLINVITGFGGQLFLTLLGFVVRTVFIYTLGKAYLGINGLFTNIISVLSLADLGVGSAITYRLYKPLAEGDDKRIRVLLKFYKYAYKAIGVVILILGLLLVPALPKLIKDYDALEGLGINAVLIYVIHLMQSVSSYLFLAYRSTIVNADQKKYILDIIHYLVRSVTSITQIIILLTSRNFIAYVVVTVFSSVAISFINGIVTKKIYPQYFLPEKESLPKAEIKEMFQDCGALFLFKINTVVIMACDNLVLSASKGLETVGIYSNYVMLYKTITDIIYKVFAAFKDSMGNLFATESIEKKYQFFKIVNFITALLFGTAGVGFAVCGNEVIVAWIGEEYILAQPIPILIGMELFLDGVVVNLGQIRSVSGIFRQSWYRPLLGIIINVVVSVALVQKMGIAGVILGTIAAYVLTNFLVEPALIFKYAFMNHKPVIEYYKTNMLYVIVCVIVGGIDMFICSKLFMSHGWLSIVVHVVITGVSVPLAFSILFWKSKEYKYLLSRMRGLIQSILKKRKKIS